MGILMVGEKKNLGERSGQTNYHLHTATSSTFSALSSRVRDVLEDYLPWSFARDLVYLLPIARKLYYAKLREQKLVSKYSMK